VPQVPLLLFESFRLVKPPHIQRCREAAAKTVVERARSVEQAMLEQTGADRHVACHFRFAFVDSPHRVRNFEPRVPELADEAFDRAFRRAVGERARQQDEYIDVRVRKKRGPTVPTDRNECGVGGRADLGPDTPDDAIRKLRLTQQEALRLQPLGKGRAERRPSRRELALPAQRFRRRRSDGGGGERRGHACYGAGASGGGEGAPEETVSTSNPSRVTSTVCSHCADKL